MASNINAQPCASKRRLKKQNNKPLKKLKKDAVTIEVVDEKPISDEENDEDSENDDTSEIDWNKLEEVLKENAEKANLTTVNVKSILHHILKDKRVIEYAQNVAENDGKSLPPDENIVETTKMTRSKAKLLGHQPPLVTILDQGSSNKPSFLDLDFPDDEEEDDEDYNPDTETETELSQPSDEEMSTISEATIDLRSPRVLLTPVVIHRRETRETSTEHIPVENHNQNIKSQDVFKVPVVPTKSTPKSSKRDDLIAKRTRSLLPLTNVELEEIEAMFDPPDFEPTMFSLEDLDDDEVIWQGWLADLMKPTKALNDTNDDPNDEDFNYMAAADEETEVDEELRDDRTTRITQKELQGLFNELLLGFDNSSNGNYDEIIHELCEDDTPEATRKHETQPYGAMEIIDATKDLKITFEERQQITAQLQQHVQLLTQVYMLSCTQTSLREESIQCKQYVEELALFHDKAVQNSNEITGSLNAELSVFCTPGIADAYRIIKSLVGQRIVTKTPKNPPKHSAKYHIRNSAISDTIAELFCSDPFFATYIELLPKRGALIGEKEKVRLRRMKFLSCENNLLAIGLSQFKGKTDERFQQIVENLLPTKSVKQLMIRTKNISYRNSIDNPIAYVKKHKTLPELENVLNITTPRDISEFPLYKLPPRIWKNRLTPFWYLRAHKALLAKEREKEEKRLMEKHEQRNNLFKIAAVNQSNQTRMSTHSNSPRVSLVAPTHSSNAGLLDIQNIHVAHIQNSDVSILNPSTISPVLATLQSSNVSLNVVTPPSHVFSTPQQVNQQTIQNFQTQQCNSAIEFSTPFQVNPYTTINFSQKHYNSAPVTMEKAPVPSINTPSNSCHSNRVHFSRTQSSSFSNNCHSSKQRVNRSLSYSEGINLYSEEPLNVSNSSNSSSSKKRNTSNDGFNMPVNMLFKDLPVPSDLPHLNFSPSKPLHETSFSEVKQFLKTPQKTIPHQTEQPQEHMQQSPQHVQEPVEDVSTKNDVSMEGLHFDPTNVLQLLKTPQKQATSVCCNDIVNNTEISKSTVDVHMQNFTADNDELKDTVDGCPSPCTKTPDDSPVNQNTPDDSPVNQNTRSNQYMKHQETLPRRSANTIQVHSNEQTIKSLLDEQNTDRIFKPLGSPDCDFSTTTTGQYHNVSAAFIQPENSGNKPNNQRLQRTPKKQLLAKPSENNCNTSLLQTPKKNGNNSFVDEKKNIHNKTKIKKMKKKRNKKEVFDYEKRLKQRALDFAEIYFARVRETLSDQPYLCFQFFILMDSVNKSQLTKLETYYKVAELLSDYPELVDNFSGFLEQHEARHVGKYMEWLMYALVLQFHLNCEQHFFNVPGHYHKISQKILDVTSITHNSRQVVNQVAPLFQGNTSLTNQFIRLFPDLSPPPCNDDDFEVIDFAAVSAGLKEIDDFEDIAYQPPETCGDFFPGEEENHRKRSDSTSSRKELENNKYRNKKSNTNITASKLKQLASKRKKKPTRKPAEPKLPGLVVLQISGEEDNVSGFQDELIRMDTSKELSQTASSDEIFSHETTAIKVSNEKEEPKEPRDNIIQHEPMINDLMEIGQSDVKQKSSDIAIQSETSSDNHFMVITQSNEVKKLHDNATQLEFSKSECTATTNIMKTNNKPSETCQVNNDMSGSQREKKEISIAEGTGCDVYEADSSNCSIKSQDNIFYILKRDFKTEEDTLDTSKNENEDMSCNLTYPEHSLSNINQNRLIESKTECNISIGENSKYGSKNLKDDSIVQLRDTAVTNVSSETTIEKVSASIDTIATMKQHNDLELANDNSSVDFNVVSSTIKPIELEVVSATPQKCLNPITHSDSVINISSDATSEARSVIGVLKQDHADKESSEADSEVEVIMRRIPQQHHSSTPKDKHFSPNVDLDVLHGENAQFKWNLSTSPKKSEPGIESSSAIGNRSLHNTNQLSLAHELTFPEYPADPTKNSTFKNNNNEADKGCALKCKALERHLSFSELIKKTKNSAVTERQQELNPIQDICGIEINDANNTGKAKHGIDTSPVTEEQNESVRNVFDSISIRKTKKVENENNRVNVESSSDCSRENKTLGDASKSSTMFSPFTSPTLQCGFTAIKTTKPKSVGKQNEKVTSPRYLKKMEPATNCFSSNTKSPIAKKRTPILTNITPPLPKTMPTSFKVTSPSAEKLASSSTTRTTPSSFKKKRKSAPPKLARRLSGKDITMIASAEDLADKSDFFSGDSMDSVRSDSINMKSFHDEVCSPINSTIAILNEQQKQNKERVNVTTLPLVEPCDKEKPMNFAVVEPCDKEKPMNFAVVEPCDKEKPINFAVVEPCDKEKPMNFAVVEPCDKEKPMSFAVVEPCDKEKPMNFAVIEPCDKEKPINFAVVEPCDKEKPMNFAVVEPYDKEKPINFAEESMQYDPGNNQHSNQQNIVSETPLFQESNATLIPFLNPISEEQSSTYTCSSHLPTHLHMTSFTNIDDTVKNIDYTLSSEPTDKPSERDSTKILQESIHSLETKDKHEMKEAAPKDRSLTQPVPNTEPVAVPKDTDCTTEITSSKLEVSDEIDKLGKQFTGILPISNYEESEMARKLEDDNPTTSMATIAMPVAKTTTVISTTRTTITTSATVETSSPTISRVATTLGATLVPLRTCTATIATNNTTLTTNADVSSSSNIVSHFSPKEMLVGENISPSVNSTMQTNVDARCEVTTAIASANTQSMNSFTETPWKEGEDEAILFTIVKDGDSSQTLESIAEKLQTRSVTEVKERLKFLMQQIGGSSSSSSSSEESEGET